MTVLIETKAPREKFRVIADDFGKWSDEHSDVLVGDFDGIEQSRNAAQPARSRPRHERWAVRIFDDKGAIV